MGTVNQMMIVFICSQHYRSYLLCPFFHTLKRHVMHTFYIRKVTVQ
jgi:hypothetical protein